MWNVLHAEVTTPDIAFPAESASCFEVLGVAVSVDDASLASALRRRLRAWHPDRFGTAAQALREDAELASALANDAFRRLADPFDRGEYLLFLERGIRPDALKTRMDPEFFGEMMEIQERCDAISGVSDPSSGPIRDSLEADRKRLESEIAGLISKLRKAFAAYDSGDRDGVLDQISEVVAVRGYLRRALEAVRRALA